MDTEPKMVGREEDFEELQAYLEMAADGFGSTILVSGEAGIGKTRLVEEVKDVAQARGFKVLSGYSLYESLTPYMPFLEALKSGGLDHLFAEEAPRVEGVYLVTNTGLLVKEAIREETELDPDIFASMLNTVGNFVKDSLFQLKGEETLDRLNKLGYGNYTILIEAGINTNLAVILTGDENEFLISEMRDTLQAVDKRYGSVLKDWDGDEDRVKGIGTLLASLLSSGKYDGIYYGKEDPKSRRNLLFENVSLGLTRQSQIIPTLLCIEDLQWADPSSLALMHYVARNTRKCSLLILGTYRPEDVTVEEGEHHPLVETMQLMGREELYRQLELNRLPGDYMVDFLTSLLGKVDFKAEFLERVYEETEGNPLFITELVRLLVDERLVEKVNEFWKLARSLEEVDIPSKIYDVIVRRLNRVGKEERRLLDYSSVIGDLFTSEILCESLGLERVQLLEQLRTLEKIHRLIRSHNGGFRFDHAKIREVLYSEIPRELRMEYHSIIADSIEILEKDNLDKVIEDLAFHYYHCRNKEKAPFYLTKAAEKAKQEYSNEEAIRFYNESLEVVEDSRRRVELLKELGDVYELIGDYDRALESYEEALELADEEESIAEMRACIGRIYETKGEYTQASSMFADALHLVKGQDSDIEAEILLGMGAVHQSRGDYDIALEYYRRSKEIGERNGDIQRVASVLGNIGNIHVYKGEYDEALKKYEECLELGKKGESLRSVARILGNLGSLQSLKGDYQEALDRYEASLNIFEKIGDQQGIAYSLNNIGVLYEDKREYERALEHYRKSLEMVEKTGDQQLVVAALHNIGVVHKYLGNTDSALDWCMKSLELGEKIGHQVGMAFNYCSLAEIYLKKEDLENALDYCDKAHDLSEEIGVKEYVAASKRIFGLIHRERKEWGKSATDFEKSIEIFEQIGRDKELGETHYEFGLMWKENGDTTRAKDHLGKALKIFHALELEKERLKAEEALNSLS